MKFWCPFVCLKRFGWSALSAQWGLFSMWSPRDQQWGRRGDSSIQFFHWALFPSSICSLLTLRKHFSCSNTTNNEKRPMEEQMKRSQSSFNSIRRKIRHFPCRWLHPSSPVASMDSHRCQMLGRGIGVCTIEKKRRRRMTHVGSSSASREMFSGKCSQAVNKQGFRCTGVKVCSFSSSSGRDRRNNGDD